MLKPEENELLCRVGPDTGMGGLLRRYWLPVACGDELVAGGAPIRTRLLSEDLVAFRDPGGRVGVLDEHCPHRGASLSLARNEECGLRCIYHGWKIGADGRVRETPSEPESSSFRHRIRHAAYPVHESGGLVWAYLGSQDAPEPRAFEWTLLPASHYVVFKARVACNWVQGLEGVIDSAHLTHLHKDLFFRAGDAAGGERLGSISMDGSPRLEIEDTAYGFRYAALRRAGDEASRLVRLSHFVAPCFGLFAGPMALPSVQAYVPEDDHNTAMYFVIADRENPIGEDLRAALRTALGMVPGVDLDAGLRRVRRAENGWLQDREAMGRGETFTGIAGVNAEDQAVQESMGRLYDRGREHLGTSDVAVIRMRRIMINAARRYLRGERDDLVGLGAGARTDELCGFERLAPAAVPWQELVGADA
ncbi:Rieske 2Fe-2S domain-containing protein [Pseudonocardia acaciae]|uniref:Rieske 2Fe-2S domain-containing protein n=1 Tax=Pseudonocardia acaciae TaxID=551276 RepID=UPI00048B72BD|nr:Rieske 2Fe-2S domain-containing protein [Pseudonocardia acaciae]